MYEPRLIKEAHDLVSLALPTNDETEARAVVFESCTRLNERFGEHWGQLLPLYGAPAAPRDLIHAAKRMQRVSEFKHALPVTSFEEISALLALVDEMLRREIGMIWSAAFAQRARLPRPVQRAIEAVGNIVPFPSREGEPVIEVGAA